MSTGCIFKTILQVFWFQTSNIGLNCIRCHEGGELLAVGDEVGKTYVIKMNDWFVTPEKNDKALLTAVSYRITFSVFRTKFDFKYNLRYFLCTSRKLAITYQYQREESALSFDQKHFTFNFYRFAKKKCLNFSFINSFKFANKSRICLIHIFQISAYVLKFNLSKL